MVEVSGDAGPTKVDRFRDAGPAGELLHGADLAGANGFTNGNGHLQGRPTHIESEIKVQVLAPDEVLVIHATGIISDVDDNALMHSGQEVHDGHRARFARALTAIFREHYSGRPDHSDNREVQARLLRANETGSIFEEQEWAESYRILTGKAETDVVEQLAKAASGKLGLRVSPNQLERQVFNTLDAHFPDFMAGVEVDRGLRNFLRYGKDVDMRITFCSASCPQFILRALEDTGLLSFVTAETNEEKKKLVVCDARKKTGEGQLCSDGFSEAASRLGLPASECFVVGDTPNDLSSLLAGVQVCAMVKRPGDTTDFESFIQTMSTKYSLPPGLQVFILEDLGQLRAQHTWCEPGKPASASVRKKRNSNGAHAS